MNHLTRPSFLQITPSRFYPIDVSLRPALPGVRRVLMLLFLVFLSGGVVMGKETLYLASGDGRDIVAALHSLPEEGGAVVLGPVLFPVSEAIVIDRDGVELRGISEETTLRLTDHANCSVIVIGTTNTPVDQIVKGISVRNLVIDGNRGAQDFECTGGPCDGGGLAYIRNN
ncbi:MAG: hypothetical protein KA250_12950, partial [Verrucomicrobiales bacterium]|nr:hypothetical protein [Verrucomicrobiales bacterium]